MKIKKLIRKCKYSAESVYIFTELKKRNKAEKAMRFHELKIAVQLAVLIFVCQMVLLGIILLVR